jgi:SsrA-binding protein
MARKSAADETVLATNRRAAHEFQLLRRIEAGIVLTGPEVKSARQSKVSLKEAFARIEAGEVFLHGAHFSPYSPAARENPDPLRVRKLLLHGREILKLERETRGTGMTLVPLRLYLKDGRVKVELAVARGKRVHDKREAIRGRELDREAARARSTRAR